MIKEFKHTSGEYCYSLCERTNTPCQKNNCRNWINLSEEQNCVLLAAKSGPKTLQEVGQIFGISKVRVGQIEKKIYEKVSLALYKEEKF